MCDYTNDLFFHAVMKLLFLDESKLGRIFRSFFKDGINIPAMAFFATSVRFIFLQLFLSLILFFEVKMQCMFGSKDFFL